MTNLPKDTVCSFFIPYGEEKDEDTEVLMKIGIFGFLIHNPYTFLKGGSYEERKQIPSRFD